MKGFFKEKIVNIKPITRKKKGKVYTCEDCGLFTGCRSPKMEPTGEGRLGVLFITEVPGKLEDIKGQPLIGDDGQLLRRYLPHGFDLDKDAIKLNAVNCRPKNNRTPNNKEISACRSRVLNAIDKYKPKKIILLGTLSIKSLIGDREKTDSIKKWVGWKIPDQKIGSWIYPNYHPSYVLRDEKNIALHKLFKQHLKEALNHNEIFPNYGNEEEKVEIINNVSDVVNYLKNLNERCPEWLAFDLETTGLKPHAKGHKIVCLSISIDGNSAVAFPYFNDSYFLNELKILLTNQKIKKIAHNIQMEDEWSRFFLNIDVFPWGFDTILSTHYLDNRSNITGLKTQSYLNFGLSGYEDVVSPYLKSGKENGANGINRIMEIWTINKAIVMKYCGIDSMMCFRLFEKHKDKCLNNSAYNLLLDGAIELSHVSHQGFCLDVPYYELQNRGLLRRIKAIKNKIDNSDEIEKWKSTENIKFNPNSDDHVNKLLFEKLGYQASKINTTTGSASCDKSVLTDINTKFTKDLLELRRNEGMQEKVDGFLRECVDGILRTMYSLNIPRTMRSSSYNPNWQNLHKRDEEAQKIIRSGIKPRDGRILAETDYSGAEVTAGIWYHKDPVMIKYIKDKSTDMHRDQAMELFFLDPDTVTKKLRYHAKNGFVFPSFYGSYWGQIAPDLWKRLLSENISDGTSVMDHLKKNNIKNYADFEKHVKKVEDRFWNEKFIVYTQWKKDTWDFYNRNLYVKSLDGFIFSGLMKRNDVLNYPIQGLAFHCLLKSLISLNRIARKEKWDTKIIGQIHDSIIMDIEPSEMEHVLDVTKRVMTEDIVENWKFAIVPLEIETSLSEINGDWYNVR